MSRAKKSPPRITDAGRLFCGFAARLSLRTSTGSITGSLLTGKRFDAKTDTGRVSVPASQNSGGVCVAATHTGDIVIDVL